ncbi:MAG: phycobiliprotein lyase [Cyanobacteria bacterium P01_G01_bin.54]
MDIHAFIDQVVGDWFSQKTVYDLAGATNESRKCNLTVIPLAHEDAAIAPLCQTCRVDPSQVGSALKFQWDTDKVDPYQSRLQGESLLVLLKSEGGHQGSFIRSGATAVGQYDLDADGVLTLTQIQDPLKLSDRLWFAAENLRFRTGLVERAGQITHTSFYSEIRRLLK